MEAPNQQNPYMEGRPSSGAGVDGHNQMRPSTKSNISAISTNDFSSGKWKLEKNKMQQTILTLSQEVEYLSVRNAKLLSDLKRKEPLYDVYVKTSEELLKLR